LDGERIVETDSGGERDVKRYESGQLAEKPEVTEEHTQRAKEMAESYEESRPTTVLPGTENTVTGTAVNDWVDDDGNPKFGNDDKDDGKDDDEDGGKHTE